MKRAFFAIAAATTLIGCEIVATGVTTPTGLAYVLEPSGDPDVPFSITLYWDRVADSDLKTYNVYGRLNGSTVFDLRASTTSPSFHDEGGYDAEYYVTAVNDAGDESNESGHVLIDEVLRLVAPTSLGSITLDGAVHLYWSDNPFTTSPDGFKNYRVYSSSYTLGDVDCGTDWGLEGTTVAPEFLVGALDNGVSRCFAVTAESIEGWESYYSPTIWDTPRFDARNILMFAQQVDLATSGFRFETTLGDLGVVTDGNRADIDFVVDRDGAGTFWFVPVRTGTQVALYSATPVDDLTAIDIAPTTGFATSAISMEPGFGYVFEMDGGDGFLRYGAIRPTHVGADYIIFDWAYQTDPGNPQLDISGGMSVYEGGGVVVSGKH